MRAMSFRSLRARVQDTRAYQGKYDEDSTLSEIMDMCLSPFRSLDGAEEYVAGARGRDFFACTPHGDPLSVACFRRVIQEARRRPDLSPLVA